MPLKCVATLIFVVFYFRPDLFVATEAISKENCDVSNGVKRYYQKFVDSYIRCPPSLAECEGIGLKASHSCKTCCASPTGLQNCSSNDNSLPSWAIAIIVLLGFIIVAIAACFGFHPVFYIRERINSPTQETQDSTVSYTPVVTDVRNKRISTPEDEAASQNGSTTLNDSQDIADSMEATYV